MYATFLVLTQKTDPQNESSPDDEARSIYSTRINLSVSSILKKRQQVQNKLGVTPLRDPMDKLIRKSPPWIIFIYNI